MLLPVVFTNNPLYVAFIASDEAAILLIDWRNGLHGSYLQDPGGM